MCVCRYTSEMLLILPAVSRRLFQFLSPPPSAPILPSPTPRGQLSPPAHLRKRQLAVRVELTPPESTYVGGGGVVLESMGRTITPGMGSALVIPAKLRQAFLIVCVSVYLACWWVVEECCLMRAQRAYPLLYRYVFRRPRPGHRRREQPCMRSS